MLRPMHALAGLVLLLFCGYAQAQEPKTEPTSPTAAQEKEAKPDTVVLSGVATTARVADPNERVVFSGRVMRMADFVAAVSSSIEEVQRLRNLEKRSRETAPPTPPSKQKN